MRRILSALSAFSVPAVPARAKSGRGTEKATAGLVSRTAGQAVSTGGAAGLDALETLEALEGRQMMTVNILNPIPDRTVGISSANVVIDLNNRYDNPLITGTVLRFNTNQPGTANSFNIELFDAAKASGDTTQPFRTRTTPLTVANFLNYRNAGRYTNSIIHRSVPNFVIQGGGFTGPTSPSNASGPEADPREITTFPRVNNEPGNSNARGTISMARVGGEINSATSQWFFNTVNNNTSANGATNLDNVDEGFTAFGRVLGAGMTVVDAMAAVPNFNANAFYGLNSQNGPLGQLPLRDLANNTTVIQPNQFVTITNIVVVNEITYTALTNNGALVSPSFNSSGNLVLGFNPGQSGAAVITVRATSADGSFVDDSFTVGVTPVTIGPVVSNVLSVAYAGLPISLSAASPASIGAGIARVDFFRDVNGNGLVDTGTDVLLGSDFTDAEGWTLNNVSTLDFPAGNVTILAVAVDDSPSAFRSAPSATTVAVQASTPVSVAAVGTNANNNIIAYTGVPLTLTVTNPTTIADSATITRVETFRDVNNNGAYDAGTDVSLGFDTDGSNGWAIVADTTLLGQGTNSLLTIATDSTGRTSVPRVTTLTVTALSPVSVGIFSVNPGVLTRLTDPLTLRLSSAATQIAAATIIDVKFYRDSNGNGTFDVSDVLLGTVTTPTAGGAYELVISDPSAVGFVRNTNNVFAIATDSTSRTSVEVRQTVTGAPPVTASPADVLRGNSTILSVAPISGTAAPTRSVAFYVDRNGDGIISAGDTLLGSGTVAGGIYRITVTASALALGSANTGSFVVMARATLTNSTTVDYANTTVVVANNLPKVNSVVSSLPVITILGSDFRLTATVSDRDGSISRVTFYSDNNNDGVFTPGTDIAVGVDDSATGGWSIALTSGGLLTGSYRFFAVATDNNGGESVPAPAIGSTPAQGTVIVRLNAAPTIAAVGGVSTVTRGGMLTLQALQVLDDQQIDNNPSTTATIRRVEFFRDVDGDGLLTPGVDVFLGNGTRSTITGAVTYRLVIPTTGYTSGENGFLARAVDSDNVTGAVVSGTAVISNAAPRAPTVTATPSSSSQPGIGTIRFTATNVSDPDGVISNVAFFLDDGDGQFQPGADTLLGEDLSASGGWTVTAATPSTSGIFRVFCVVTDGEASSTNGIVFFRVNPLPVISTATGNGVVVISPATGPVARGTNFTVVARGVTDAPGDTGGTVTRVEFWRDLNGNGLIDTTDQRLGNGVRSLGPGSRVDYTYSGSSAGFATGANTIMARAVDNNGGLGLPVNTTLAVSNATPIVGSLAIAGSVLATPGVDNLTLTATFPAATLGAIGRVQFYFDSNDDGAFNIADDLLVGTDTSSAGGWTVSAPTSTVTGSTARYFAVVTDTDNVVAAAVATATINVNTRPTIGSLALNASTVVRRDTVIATSQPAADSDGTVSRVEFWRDRAGGVAGEIDSGDQLLGVGVRQTDGTYRLSFSTSGFATGDNTILSQAIDNRGGRSLASSATLAVTNTGPAITGVTVTPTIIVTAGITTISLTATGVADADGSVASVRFYRDTDNDGAFTDGVDTLLGTDTSAQGGWTWTNASTAGVTGISTQYFAIATDADGATAISPMRIVTVNQPPTVGGIVLSSTTAIRRSSITATATGVADPDTGGSIGRVEFWRDSDRNGVIGTASQDQFLGNGVRQADGTYRITFSTAGFLAGAAVDPFTGTSFDNTILVRAFDNRGGVGATTSTVLSVSDVAPVAGRFAVVGTAGVVADPASPLTLTITGPTDVDGVVEEAFFYYDTNNNGVVDTGTDILLGSDNNAVGGWSLLFSPNAVAGDPFVSGVTHQVLAVVRDNNNVRSAAIATTFTFNPAPVVGSVTVNGTAATGLGSISRTGTANTLVASGVTDNGSIARVEFWLDANDDGAITSADRLLGVGIRVGTSTTWQFVFNGSIIPGSLSGDGKLLTRSIDNLGRNSLISINNITIT